MKRLCCSLVFLLVSMSSFAGPGLSVSYLSGEVGSSTDLGMVEVDGLGMVKLVASKDGNQLTILAQDSNGEVVGKAETVVGLKDTPIYVMSSAGLQKITIFWGKQ